MPIQIKPVIWEAPSNIQAFSTTRIGGYSKGEYKDSNLSLDVGDEQTNVRKNRRDIKKTLGLGRISVLTDIRPPDSAFSSFNGYPLSVVFFYGYPYGYPLSVFYYYPYGYPTDSAFFGREITNKKSRDKTFIKLVIDEGFSLNFFVRFFFSRFFPTIFFSVKKALSVG